MNFYGIRELRNDTRAIMQVVSQEGNAIITDNGKPAAMLLSISEKDFDAVYEMVQRYRATRAFDELQKQALNNAPLTMDEIDAEIAAVRRELQEHGS